MDYHRYGRGHIGKGVALVESSCAIDACLVNPFRTPGERLFPCEAILEQYGRQVLEELLGVRNRDWGAAEEEDG